MHSQNKKLELSKFRNPAKVKDLSVMNLNKPTMWKLCIMILMCWQTELYICFFFQFFFPLFYKICWTDSVNLMKEVGEVFTGRDTAFLC